MTFKPICKRSLKILAWFSTTLLLVLLIVFMLHRPSNDVVHQWQQPASITYDDWGPYYLKVVERDIDWSNIPFHIERNYFIYAGRDSGEPSHGHVFNFSFHPSPDDLLTFLRKATTHWTEQGVELELPSGHRVFIPKDMFIGGR